MCLCWCVGVCICMQMLLGEVMQVMRSNRALQHLAAEFQLLAGVCERYVLYACKIHMLLSFSLPIRISRSHTHILLLSLARTRAFAHSLYLSLSLSHCPSKCCAPSSICGLSSFCGCVNQICICVEYIHTSLLPPCAHFSHTLSLSGILALAHARSLSLSLCHSLSLSLRVLAAEF